MHALLLCSFVCPNKSVCSSISSMTLSEIRNCVCRGTFQAGLCLQQYHMFVQRMCSQHHSGLCLQQYHMFVQCIRSQSGLRLLLSHMFAQCICSQNHSQLYHDGLVSDNLLFLWVVLWIFFIFFLQSFLLVQTQSALQSPPKSKGGKQPVADNKRNTTQH